MAAWLLRRDHPRLKWSAVALMGITAMQWTEGLLWLDGPRPNGIVNQLLTVGLIPLALLAQAWGPLFGSLYDRPVRGRKVAFFTVLILGLTIVLAARVVYHPIHTQITPQGHLNWYSPQNPPMFVAWAYGLWAFVIGLPFLLWWRPFWQSLAIVAWGWIWALVAWFISDSAASYWCFFVTFYAVFVLIYSFMVSDPPKADPGQQTAPDPETIRHTTT
ncbi:MAG: hypothetical protein ACR2NP_06405 [Pirellulaceae bacterium]